MARITNTMPPIINKGITIGNKANNGPKIAITGTKNTGKTANIKTIPNIPKIILKKNKPIFKASPKNKIATKNPIISNIFFLPSPFPHASFICIITKDSLSSIRQLLRFY